jgi:hypothetical protein
MHVAVRRCINADNCQKCCVVAWQCSSPYCEPFCYAPAAMLWHIRTSPHGHDHAQSGIHLYGLFKDALKGYYFESNYKLTDKYVAYHLIRNMFSNGIHKLMQCWTKYWTGWGGDYDEKWCTCELHISAVLILINMRAITKVISSISLCMFHQYNKT